MSSKETGGAAGPASRGLLVLVLLTVAQFLIVLDYTIVTVALPSIVRELGVSLSLVQWVVTVYGLTLAGFLLLSGRAGDAYGHKRLFIAGLLIFSLASLASGLAPSIGLLIAARAVQGVGAAIGSATGLSILVATFPEGPERNRALGIFGAVMGSGFIIGMVAGGLITTYLGWRWVFDVTVPIGLAAASIASKVIEMPHTPGKGTGLDLPGAATVTGGLMLLVYALASVQTDRAVTTATLGVLALSVVLLASFTVIELRTARPLLPLGFLRRRLVFTANVIALMTVSAFVGSTFLLTVYMQQVLGYSPLYAGLAFAPGGLVFYLVSAYLSARFINRSGVRTALIFGEGLALLGYLLMTQVSASGNYFTVVLPATITNALGLGIAFPAYSIAALRGAKRGEEGLASGVINTSRQLGGPIGVASLLTVATLLDPPPSGPQQFAGIVAGMDYAFLGAAILAVVAVVLALSLKATARTPEPK